MKETLQKLVLLQQVDNEKLILKHKKQNVLDELKADTEEYRRLQKEVEEQKKRQMEIRVEGERLNLEQKTLEERSTQLRKRQDLVRNTEESKAVGREMVANEQELQKLFEQLDRQSSDLEKNMQVLAATQSRLYGKRSELEEKLPGKKAEIVELDKQIAEVNLRRESVWQSLPNEARARYRALIQTRAPHMVVEVQKTQDGDHACSGCNIGLPPQVIGDIMKGEELVCCENCGRILFLPEAQK